MRIQSLALSAILLSALPALAANTPVSPAVSAALGTEMPWEIDLDAGMKSVALVIDEVFVGESHDDLLGLGFHPEFGMGTSHDFVYVAYAYDSGKSGAVEDRRSRIVKFQWDAETGTLSDPVELFSGIPAGAGQKK